MSPRTSRQSCLAAIAIACAHPRKKGSLNNHCEPEQKAWITSLQGEGNGQQLQWSITAEQYCIPDLGEAYTFRVLVAAAADLQRHADLQDPRVRPSRCSCRTASSLVALPL